MPVFLGSERLALERDRGGAVPDDQARSDGMQARRDGAHLHRLRFAHLSLLLAVTWNR
jgi:hypothetical protein